MQENKRKTAPNTFYQLAILAGFCFVVTILALVATLFGNDQAPAARLFNRYVSLLLIIEVLLALCCSFAGMVYDNGPVAEANPAELPAGEPLLKTTDNSDLNRAADTE